MTLAEFLTARLEEDEAAAQAASPGPWHLDTEGEEVVAVDDVLVADVFALSGNQLRATADFIVRHDPARVLREVEAKRKIVAEHRPYDTTDPPPAQRCYVCASSHAYGSGAAIQEAWPCPTMRALDAVYSDHPDYDPAWA